MSKLPALTSKTLIKKLKTLGFIEDHQKGSHKVFYHHISGRRAVVPFHVKDLPKGTLLAILREAGVEKEDIG